MAHSQLSHDEVLTTTVNWLVSNTSSTLACTQAYIWQQAVAKGGY